MKQIEVTIGGTRRLLPEGTLLRPLAREYQPRYRADIVLAIVNGKLQELHKTLQQDAEVEFVTTEDTAGHAAYERSALLMLNKAVYDVIPSVQIRKVVAEFSVSNGIYLETEGNSPCDEAFLEKVRGRMRELQQADLPILKATRHAREAMTFFREAGMTEKEKVFRYRRSSFVNLYSLDGFADYYYGYMVPSTGYLREFDLRLYKDGFVLELPSRKEPSRVAPFVERDQLYSVMKEDVNWGRRMNMATVGDINDMITGGQMEDLILIAEARQEAKISAIADRIQARPDVKLVMVAGPSSSGKTSFSHRLSIQLKARGLNPHPLAVDDYFVDRENTPLDENGEYDFEALECVDTAAFRRDMTALLAGEKVAMPAYDFLQGKRCYRGNSLQIGKSDILVIEGIHCLNDALTEGLSPDCRFRIYISALTQLNIDEHNRIPTTDGRLIRRMIRDARTRGNSARDTIARWPSVRRGEDRNIFPYQESADVMFNSSLIYEFSVMKPYAEPLLFGIPKNVPEYREAKRLLKFFDYFLTIPTDAIPRNSLLKEFIGGSIFPV